MLYGGKTGIEAVINADQPIPKGKEEVVKIMMSLKWKSKNHPYRCDSPMA